MTWKLNSANNMEEGTLIGELRTRLSIRVMVATGIVSLIGIVLHGLWVFSQRESSASKIRDAVAHVVQEPIRTHDLVAIKRAIRAFHLANPLASVCLRLPNEVVVEGSECENAEYDNFIVPLGGESFQVGVVLGGFEPMTLIGLPFLGATMTLLIMLAVYLRRLARRITGDLVLLVSGSDVNEPFFSEFRQVRASIKEGVRHRIENETVKNQLALVALSRQVAHDIRSPLTSMKSALHLLSAGDSESAHRLLLLSAQRVQNIAEDLLVKPDASIPVPRWQSLSRVVALVRELVDAKVLEIDIRISLEVPTIKAAWAFIDLSSVERVLSNLINNSYEAGARQAVLTIWLDEKCNQVLVRLVDDGRGFSSEYLSRSPAIGRSTKLSGFGLGLRNAIDQIEGWGGRLHFSNDLQTKGACIEMRFQTNIKDPKSADYEFGNRMNEPHAFGPPISV